MKKATRVLVNWINDKIVKSVDVKPLHLVEAKPNQCFQNMMLFLDNNDDWNMHSGWLVGDYLGERGTAIVPHFWVVNPQNQHFDITPRNASDTQSYEYVSDFNIAKYVTQDVQLPVPLKLNQNGEFLVLHKDGSFAAIEKMDYRRIFSLATQ